MKWSVITLSIIVMATVPTMAASTINLQVLPGHALGPLTLDTPAHRVRSLLPWYSGYTVVTSEDRDEQEVVRTSARVELYRWEERGENKFRWDVVVPYVEGRARYLWSDDPQWAYRQVALRDLTLGFLIRHLGEPSHIEPRSPRLVFYVWDDRGVAFALYNASSYMTSDGSEGWKGWIVMVYPKGSWEDL